MTSRVKNLAICMLLSVGLSGCWETDSKTSQQSCEEKIKKDYPVPPGNINAQKQMIEQECHNK
jgi:hypothetical protein